MAERTITFQGNPLHLLGQPTPGVGAAVPDAVVLKTDLTPVHLSEFIGKGKVVVISSVPSLDTPVCADCTKRFHQRLRNSTVLTISADLPFAQARWMKTSIPGSNVVFLSDHKDFDFGDKFGLHIQELRLLARAVFVVGKNGKICYSEIIPEMTDHPNYDAVYSAVDAAESQ